MLIINCFIINLYQKFFLKIKNKNFIKVHTLINTYFIHMFQIEVKKDLKKKKSMIHEDWNSYDDPLSDQNFP